MGSTPEEVADALNVVGDDRHWQNCVKSESPLHRLFHAAVLSRRVRNDAEGLRNGDGDQPSSFLK